MSLHSPSHNRFMRMDDELRVNAWGGRCDSNMLPNSWGAERIRVVVVGKRPSAHGVKEGKWMVLTEEGPGNVVFYPFDCEEHAWNFFNHGCQVWLARVIFDASGHERNAAGWNGWANDTIRRTYLSRMN